MGFSIDQHIQHFVRGKMIDHMETRGEGAIILFHFADGESLRLTTIAHIPSRPGIETIATPFDSDGGVIQSR